MKYSKLVTPVAIVAALMAIFVNVGSTKVAGGYSIGDIARDFTLKNVNGQMVSMADYSSAKGFIVIFTCNSCPFSQMYEDRIIALHNQYEPQGYPVIAINPNDPGLQPADSFEKMKERAADKGFPFPYLIDETQDIVSAYGATRTPHVFVLQRNSGDLVVQYIGTIDNNHKDAQKADKKYVENAVDALLNGQEVETTFTKAIGCTIKWKRS